VYILQIHLLQLTDSSIAIAQHVHVTAHIEGNRNNHLLQSADKKYEILHKEIFKEKGKQRLAERHARKQSVIDYNRYWSLAAFGKGGPNISIVPLVRLGTPLASVTSIFFFAFVRTCRNFSKCLVNGVRLLAPSAIAFQYS
jgi:hypothetical protein